MRLRHVTEGVGRIVKGVNTTSDVDVNQTSIEAAKFGNKVDKDGRPPTLSSKVKGKSTNVLFNLGLSESKNHKLFKEALGEIANSTEIYVDMDGVLADFFGDWAKLMGVDHFSDIPKQHDINDALQKIRDTEDFWLNLPLTNNAKNLLGLIKQVKGSYKILSSPLADDPRSEPHKREWIEKNLGFFPPEEVIITHNKPKYATQKDGTPNILIDDYGVNINAWEAAGGYGFKHKDHKFERTAKNIKQHMQEPVEEASYEGNVGIMELVKFFQSAPEELADKVRKLIKQKQDKEVWKIVQQYTDTKLKGKEFDIEEKWSAKYKRSINCSNPKGFSQKAHCAGRKKNEDVDVSMDEGKFRANDIEEFKPDNKALNNLKSKYLPDWEMLDHRILQAQYVADDHRAAVAFVKIINSLSEQMDHFCEVTQDVNEVTIKTTTSDVKGLTILDFQIAMVIDRFASDVGIKQVPMSGNFGMHEDIELDEGIVDSILDFLKPYVEKAQGKLKRLQGAVKQEYMETDLMWEILRKGDKARPFEVEFANKQFKDVLKGVGLGAWLALPIPGNTLWITLLEKFLNKFDISIMPDEVKRQVFDGMYENFADGKKNEAASPQMDPKAVEFEMLSDAEKRRLAGEYERLGPELAIRTWGAALAHAVANYLGAQHLSQLELMLVKQGLKLATENFADGKKKGKSRPGRVKKAGASCKGSVTSLRKKAKKYSGEKGKMYHWCANMKSGRNK